MSLTGIFAERVAESTESAPGTGTFSLGGALGGFQTFVAGVGSGNVTIYFAVDSGGSNWESGYGTVTDANPDTLTRTAVFASSNSGNKVNFATAPTVFAYPAAAVVNSLLSFHKDSSRPAWLPAGGMWIDETNDPTWTLKLWDGTDDIEILDFDVTNNGFALKAISSATATAAEGPTLTLDRNSASPADDDLLGAHAFDGRNDAAETVTFAKILAKILDASDGTEDGELLLQAMIAGTLTTIMTAGANGITASRTLTMSSKPVELARGADVASVAGTTDIWTPDDGNIVAITGTETITGLGTAPQAGAIRIVLAADAFTLTHNATTLKLPGEANITVANGDTFLVFADTTTNMRVAFYQKADGAAVASVFSQVASTTLTTITAEATHTFAHGLGKVPELVMVYLVNTTTDLGYVAGDRVAVTSHGGDNASDVNMQVVVDATNVRVLTGVEIHLLNVSTKSWDPITLANWDFHIRAYAE